ncbi:Retrovirus-related Pol polyprotein from transposon RE1 [Vitis vinifera]|uniref:Retrovirus-related Pol polyprotein from transposon RE1 n=1 Tax=Vitis vinifera TaxID=29760 RepID=A0A438FZI0_VITVI|nr:Retrovirus-related Pol polyprotein from transposon RE1 [Vitis vinifera]
MWDEADSLIVSWLWNSMNPKISNTCMFLSMTKEIRDAVQQMYLKAYDATQVAEFDQVGVQIPSKEEVPSLNEIISLIRAEKSHKGVMLESPSLERTRTQGSLELQLNLCANPTRTFHALEKNQTWEIVGLPPGKKSMETFALMAKMNIVRVLLSLVANFDWYLEQFDVKIFFLHDNFKDEIYMDIPSAFKGNMRDNKVCRLMKVLYDLKQSPRAWFERFSKVMLIIEYRQSQRDHSLFIKHLDVEGITTLLVYADDIIVIGNDEKEKDALRRCLVKEFKTKELGRLKYFLGMGVAHSREGIFISQQTYMTNLLKETRKLACRLVSTPIDPNHKLEEANDNPIVNREMYQRLVGKLIHIAHTRPDIAYAISVAYIDADYASSPIDRRSTTSYYTFLGCNLVTWRSKKQNVVARLSAEAEFTAMA